MFTGGKDDIQLLKAGYPLHNLRKTGFYAVLDPPDGPTTGAYFVTVYNSRINVRETVQVIHNADTGASYSRYWNASGWSAWLVMAQVSGSGNLALGDVTPTYVEILIDTGTDVVIPAATSTDAGVMAAADKAKLDAIEPGAEVNLTAEEIVDLLDIELGSDSWRLGTNLSFTRDATTVTVISDLGADATLPAATTLLAGVLSAADKAKLDGIESGATADMDGSEIVAAINAALGSTAWQNADPGSSQTNPSVRVATTANITIATDLNPGDVLDDATLVDGDLVLVKNQTNPEENGIIVVGTVPARHPDFDTFDDYVGIIVTVQEGTVNADTVWLCTSDAGGTIDTDPITFVETEITPTNLSMDRDATQVEINSSTGSGTVIPAATGSLAGAMTAADKTKLDALDVDGNTDITIEHNAANVDVVPSGSGTPGTINAVTGSLAGVMTPAMFLKLDGIEEGAQVNPTAAEIVSAINDELGGTGWQTEPGSLAEARAFLARRLSTMMVGASVPVTVTFPTEVYDAGNVHNTATGEYTPGVNGIVLLAVSVTGSRADASSSWGDIEIVKNGSTVLASSRDINTGYNNVALSIIDTCLATDYYTVRSIGASGSGGTIYAATFSGCMINTGTVEVEGNTNLTFSRDATTVTVESDTGSDAVLPAATDSLAGVMSAADKAKLDAIESGANNYTHPNHSGDVSSIGDGTTTISANAVSNTKLADMAQNTIKGRIQASTGDPEDLTPAQVRTMINVENGAEPNPSAAEIVTLINGELGGTGWQSSGGATNLTTDRDATTVTVLSDTGTDAILPAATTSLAGVMTASDKTKLDGIESGATGDMTGGEIVSAINAELGSSNWQAGATNLTFSRDATTVTVLSDTGTDAVLPAATTSLAGVLSAADKSLIDGIRDINAQTGTTYTFQVSDVKKLVTLDNASPITATVPPNASAAIPIKGQIDLAQVGDGQVTVAAGSGVTIISFEGRLKLAGKGAGAMLVKLATNTWILMGAIVS
jgi:hypothetical protein